MVSATSFVERVLVMYCCDSDTAEWIFFHQTTDHVRVRLHVCSAHDTIECFPVNDANVKCCSVEEIIQTLPRIPPGQDCEMNIVCYQLQVVTFGVWCHLRSVTLAVGATLGVWRHTPL